MKKEKEIKVVTLMIDLYCKKHHGTKKGELCPECQELLDYVKFRRSKCPHGDHKPFCANCTIQCYKPSMKERISKVMRYSGPRMALYHPFISISHLIETKKQRKKIAKQMEEKAKAQQKAEAIKQQVLNKLAEEKRAESHIEEEKNN